MSHQPISPHNIVVSGTPGAWLNVVAGKIADRGWSICWPDQDLKIRDGEMFFRHNRQNIEVQHIHDCLCMQNDCQVVATQLPRFYEVPYPGPREFIDQFDETSVVISGLTIAPFVDIWTAVASMLVSVEATEEEDLQVLESWTGSTRDRSYLEEVRECYVNRYNEHLVLFPRRLALTNQEVRAWTQGESDERLSQFLDSISW